MRILAMIILGLACLACSVSAAQASCSGSGQVWSCTAGSTVVEIQSAYNSASDGAMITLAPGAYTWNSSFTFTNAKGATIVCATVRGCKLNHSGGGPAAFYMGNLSGTNTKLYRITGFVFDRVSGSATAIWFNGYDTGNPSVARTMTQLRIDHNTFQDYGADSDIIFLGEVGHPAFFYGSIDNNVFTAATSITLLEYIGGGNTNTAPAGTRGTANNLFVEDNTLTIATMTNAGVGCGDSWGGASIVWRYNTMTNCLLASHGVTHAWGPVNWELYGNTFIATSGMDPGFQNGERFFHHQGSGEILAFNNVFTPHTGSGDTGMLAITHYRSAAPGVAGYGIAGRCDGSDPADGNRSPLGTYFGYPCKRQPGRDVNGVLQPIYSWLNRRSDSGALIKWTIENPWGATNPSVATHILANRDYYNAVSASPQTSPTTPFNGTVGMGFGTLANRPLICVTNPLESGGGVGYFATDQGPAGTLYRCSATNTWTVHYRPYTYPHPLRTGETPTPLGAPTNLIVQ